MSSAFNAVCKRKAVMSPFCKAKVSPFVRDGGGAFGVAGRDAEHEGVGSGGCDRASGEEASGAARGGGATRRRRAPDQAAGAPLSGERRGGSGVRASRQAAEQRHRRGSSPGGCGSGAEAVRDFGPTFAREKLVEVHGLRLSAETLRKWMIADGLWRAKARRGFRAHQSRASGLRWGLGADRRLAARVVRGSRAGVRADRVRRRRADAAAGDGVFRRGADRGVYANDAGALGGPRPAGGVLLGPPQRDPGQQEGWGGRADAVLAGFADAGHRSDPRAQPASQRGAPNGRTKRFRTGW